MQINKISNLLELFFDQYQKQDKENIFLQTLKNPQEKYSWKEVYLNINKLSEEISKHIIKGDRCLLVSENRPEWMISDLAIMLSGGITVPAYTTYTERDYGYIIDDCTPTIIIVSDEIQYEKIKNIFEKKEFVKKIILFENIENTNEEFILNLRDIFKRKINIIKNFSNLQIQRTDMACIIYTSGTQGNPKGVMLSHGGILNNCEGANELLKSFISKKPNFLTWLPLSHSYEHTVQFVQIAVGAKVFYAESIEKLIKNMDDCSPEIMTAVPRFYQNLYQKINTAFSKAEGLKKLLVNETIALGKKKLDNQKFSLIENITNFICEIFVRRKIRKQFGGNLKAFISGGGALDYDVGSFLNSVGLPTLQGYGLTETSPVVSCNPIHKIKVETVGPPFKGNQVKIADDGEILIKGENVMLGYWNKKEETAKVIIDGWLHTGDIGEIDPKDGYLKITDRKKDIIVSAGGDNISPAKIENMITNEPEIDQCVVYGDNKNYLVALIVPSKDFLKEKEKINNIIEKINKKLTLLEKIKRIQLIDENFSIENGLMTPTMKVKRKKVTEKYKNQLEKLY